MSQTISFNQFLGSYFQDMIGFVGDLRHFNNFFAIFVTRQVPRTLKAMHDFFFIWKKQLVSNTSTATSIFFNCERMIISLSKYHCAMREDKTIARTYGEFSEDQLEEIFNTIGNEPAVSPFWFIFVTVNNSKGITAQLFVFRNIKRYKVSIREYFIILIKRKKNLSNTLHITPDGEIIF